MENLQHNLLNVNEQALNELIALVTANLNENERAYLTERLKQEQDTTEITGEMKDLIHREAMFISRMQVVCFEHYEKLYNRLRELGFSNEYEPKLFEYVMEEQISEGTDFGDFKDFLENGVDN